MGQPRYPRAKLVCGSDAVTFTTRHTECLIHDQPVITHNNTIESISYLLIFYFLWQRSLLQLIDISGVSVNVQILERRQPVQQQPIRIEQRSGPNILIRVIYFFVFGLWFSGIWATIAWILCVTIIGLPVGLWMLNRMPQVVTLAPQRNNLVIVGGQVYQSSVPQRPFLIRALWFILVGWWLSAIWLLVAWALSASIIGMVFAFWMFDRVPAIITLARR